VIGRLQENQTALPGKRGVFNPGVTAMPSQRLEALPSGMPMTWYLPLDRSFKS
jgi:hypothetical protein